MRGQTARGVTGRCGAPGVVRGAGRAVRLLVGPARAGNPFGPPACTCQDEALQRQLPRTQAEIGWWRARARDPGDRGRRAGRPRAVPRRLAGIGTPAQGGALKYGTTDVALAREGTVAARPSEALSVSASRLLAGNGQEMWMVADRKVPEVSRLTANLDVPGAVCRRVERVLVADGALPAGRAAYAVSIADPSAPKDLERVVDVSLKVKKTVREGPRPWATAATRPSGASRATTARRREACASPATPRACRS